MIESFVCLDGIEAVYNPLMKKCYESGGMPGGMPDMGQPPQEEDNSGPTVEEVD